MNEKLNFTAIQVKDLLLSSKLADFDDINAQMQCYMPLSGNSTISGSISCMSSMNIVDETMLEIGNDDNLSTIIDTHISETTLSTNIGSSEQIKSLQLVKFSGSFEGESGTFNFYVLSGQS